jgi:hypothetical protein
MYMRFALGGSAAAPQRRQCKCEWFSLLHRWVAARKGRDGSFHAVLRQVNESDAAASRGAHAVAGRQARSLLED